jgi:predicted amidohydrolase YtcJ
MRAYNAAGTTGIFEGHGVAGEVIDAYRRTCAAGRQTVRARLVVSAGWSGASDADIADWLAAQAARLRGRGEGDDWVRVAGLFAEPEVDGDDARLRARCAPQTGWAGFHYDAGLPLARLKRLLHAAARERLQVCAIQTGMADLFIEVARTTPIDGLRWVVAHPATLDGAQIGGLRDNGIGVSALTGAYVWRRASQVLARVGPAREETICPIRSLLDAGVPVSLASDNVPVSLWPCVWHAVERIDRSTGRVIAAGQRIGRAEALRCASTHGAWLSFDEEERGTIGPGKLADLIVLKDDPLSVPAERLASLAPEMTLVGGRTVWSAGSSGAAD